MQTKLSTILGLLLSLSATAATPDFGNTIDVNALDRSVSPCQDFYQYSCGNWMKNNPIPEDQTSWDRSFSAVSESNNEVLRTLLENYAAGKLDQNVPYAKQLGDFYAACVDQKTVNAQTPAALQAILAEVEGVKDAKTLAAYIGVAHLRGVNALFGFGPTPDNKDSTSMIAEIDQGGLGLPDPTYYTRTDAEAVQLRSDYVKAASKLLQLAGRSSADADTAANDALAIETALAQSALPPDQRQDPTKLYFPTDLAGVKAQAPHFDWSTYVATLGVKNLKVVNVSEPKFVAALDSLLQTTTLPRLKNYLAWQAIVEASPGLGQDVYAAYFDFFSRRLNGQQVQTPRWKSCVGSVSDRMGEAVGQAYVARSFGADAKARALALVANLRKAFQEDLGTLPWLDVATREAALQKLELMNQKIGYPDHWRTYDGLAIDRGSYWKSRRAANVFNAAYSVRKIGGKTDPNEWDMTPQTVNAYYMSSSNSINFPAAILQPPFFAAVANDARNYGSIGSIIGHEMTHGFDTSGSEFDGKGNQRSWWTQSVKDLFQQKAGCLIDQYSQYQALPGLNVNGQLTITENIADEGGVKLAYRAYRMARAGKPEEAAVGGLTGNQQFFVAMAQNYCENDRDEALRRQVLSDPHSPGRFRVIGTVVNSTDFAEAFGCQAGAPMAPANRCTLW